MPCQLHPDRASSTSAAPSPTLSHTPDSSTQLDPARFHCVTMDSGTGNFLMRSNMPLAPDSDGIATSKDYGYANITQLAAQRAVEECGAEEGTLDKGYTLIEVSVANSFDDSNGLLAVRAWHSDPANFGKGRLVEWPLGTAGIFPASRVTSPLVRREVVQQMWEVDQLPSRVEMLQDMLSTAFGDTPAVVLVHCNAGCDRTGEMIGAFRLAANTRSGNDAASPISAAEM